MGISKPETRFGNCIVGCRTTRKTAMIEVTKHCNIECQYCCLGKTRNTGSNMSPGTYAEVMQFLKEWGADYLYISGGEPFIHPDIIQILQMSKQYIDRISIATNGLLVQEDHIIALASISPEYVSVSFDNVYIDQSVWGSDDERKLELIEKLTRHGIRVRVSVPIKAVAVDNDKMTDLSKKLLSLGEQNIYLRFIEKISTNDPLVHSIDFKKRDSVKNEINANLLSRGITPIFQGINTEKQKENADSNPECPCGLYVCFIDSSGHFWPCSWLAKNDEADWGKASPNNLCDDYQKRKKQFHEKYESILKKGQCPLANNASFEYK